MKKEKFENIAHEYVVSLFPTAIMLRAFALGFKQSLGKGINDVIEKLENHNISYFTRPSSWNKGHKLLVNRIKKDPKSLNKIYNKIIFWAERLVAFAQNLPKDLKKQTNKNLWQLYARHVFLNQKVYSYGLLIPLLDFHDKIFLSDSVNEILNNKTKQNLVPIYFSTLTIPLKKTYNKKQELDLLQILSNILKTKNIKNLFQKKSTEYIHKHLKQINPKILNQIKKHVKKYAWIYYVYEGPAINELHFIESLKDLINRNVNPQKKIKKHLQESKKLKKEQNEIIKKLNLGKAEKEMIELTRDAIFIKAWRRDMQTLSYYCIEPVLKEIARRLDLTLRQTRMSLPEEIDKWLKTGEVDLNLINQRIKFCVYGFTNGKEIILDGKKAKEFFKKNIKEEKIKTDITKLTGATAYKGIVKGQIKIVNSPEDMTKFNTGDILISFATNPNLMPAIRKSAAIVTDEGGITCHAAIVSRELKIPCVVGTKIATKVLKDGDLVEVDADKGIVKIINN